MIRLRQLIQFPLLVTAIAVFSVVAASSVRADGIRAAQREDYGRIVFDWNEPVRYSAAVVGGQLVVQFERPITGDIAAIQQSLGQYVAGGLLSPDGRTATFPLRANVNMRTLTVGNAVVIDLTGPPAPQVAATPTPPRTAPPAAAQPAPALASTRPAPTNTAPIPVRTGVHPDYFRMAFEWPTATGVKFNRNGDRTDIVFDAAAPIDVAALRNRMPAANRDVSVTVENGKTIVSIPTPAGSELRNFANGKTVVVDIVTKPDPKPIAATKGADAPMADALNAKAKETASQPAASLFPTQPAVAQPNAPTKLAPDKATVAGVRALNGVAVEQSEADAKVARALANADRTVDPLSARPAEISLKVPFDEPAAAAAFRRAEYLWVVFDRYKLVDVEALAKAGAPYITLVEQLPYRTNTILRFVTQPDINPTLRREGLDWIMDFRSLPMRPTRAIDVTPQLDRPEPNLFVSVSEAGRTVAFDDPEVGDYFIVIPVIPLGYGVFPARSFPDVDLPVTAQGVVIIPKSDGVRAVANRSGIEIDVDGGMALSKTAAEQISTVGPKEDFKRVLNLADWQIGKPDKYLVNKQALQIAVAQESTATKQEARLRFARFEFINGFYPEALGILRVMASTDAEVENTGPFRALRGATNVMMRRYQEASDDLNHFSLSNEEDARFWLAVARSKIANPEAQAQTLIQTGSTIRSYPHKVKIQLALIGTEAAIASGDDFGAQGFLDLVRRENPNSKEKAAIDYLDGKLNQKIGELRVALDQYSKAEKGPNFLYNILGLRDRLELEHQLGTVSTDQLIEAYEKLRYRWRGDEIELGFLLRLADLYAEKKDYGSALRTLKLATSYFRDFSGADKAGDKMSTLFEDLFLGGSADKLTPVQAISLFDEFRALLPAGVKGDEMIRKLADRLVSIDLLDQAIVLIERQVQFRVVGIERARIGARLALVHLLNREPQKAIDSLRETTVPDEPADLQGQRRRLEARALADLERAADGILLLGADTSNETRQLRAEIYWRSKDWPNAAKALADLVPEPDSGSLSDANARLVLDWATALTLAGDDRTIVRLRQRYLPAMAQTPYRDAFDLMTTSREAGVMDPAAVRRQIEQAQNFKSFIVEYKDMIGDKPLSAIN